MWDPPGPGIEPVSPALAGGFLTTGPPGKSLSLPFKESWELDSVLRFYIDSLCWPSDNPIRVQFSCSVVSGSLWPHGLQHAMPPCPSPTSRVCSTHVHRAGDAFQLSHPLSSPSPPAFSLSQHQGLFKWVSSLHQVAKRLEFQPQHQSFQWIFRTDFL